MLSYPSSSYNQNLYSSDYYGLNTSSPFDPNPVTQEDTYDQFFGYKENFFDNFLLQYNHGKFCHLWYQINKIELEKELEEEFSLNRTSHYYTLVEESSNCATSCYGESETSLGVLSNETESKCSSEKKIFFNHDDLKKTPIKESIINENLCFSQSSLIDFLEDDKTIIEEEKTCFSGPIFAKSDLKLPNSESPLKFRMKKKSIQEAVTPRKNYKYSNRHRFKQSQVILKFYFNFKFFLIRRLVD